MLVDTHSRVYHGRTAIPTNVGAWTVTELSTGELRKVFDLADGAIGE